MTESKSQPMTVSIEEMYDCPCCGSSDVVSNVPMEDTSYVVETLRCQGCLFAWEIEYDVNRDVPEPEPPEITSRPAVVWTGGRPMSETTHNAEADDEADAEGYCNLDKTEQYALELAVKEIIRETADVNS